MTSTMIKRSQNIAELRRYISGTLVQEIDYGLIIYTGSNERNMTFVALDERGNLGQIVIDQNEIEFQRGILSFHGSWDVSPFKLDEKSILVERAYRSAIKEAES